MTAWRLGPPMAVQRQRSNPGHRWNVLYPKEGIEIRVTMDMAYGELEIVGLEIHPVRGDVPGVPKFPPLVISAQVLRAIPIAKLKAACLADLASDRSASFLRKASERPKRGRAPVPLDRLQQAATEYVEASRLQLSPIMSEVARNMGLTPATARKYLRHGSQTGIARLPRSTWRSWRIELSKSNHWEGTHVTGSGE